MIFKKCPDCGRRFVTHIVEKKLVDEKVSTRQISGVATPNESRLPSPTGAVRRGSESTYREKQFQLACECKHCGHKWFETKVEIEYT